jgi:hypothetical protein
MRPESIRFFADPMEKIKKGLSNKGMNSLHWKARYAQAQTATSSTPAIVDGRFRICGASETRSKFRPGGGL